MAAGGAFGTTGPGFGSKITGAANASWIGPCVRVCIPAGSVSMGVGSGGGACLARVVPDIPNPIATAPTYAFHRPSRIGLLLRSPIRWVRRWGD